MCVYLGGRVGYVGFFMCLRGVFSCFGLRFLGWVEKREDWIVLEGLE